MIVTLGILSFAQLVVVPGFIVSRSMKLRGLINYILFVMPVSLIANYIFVFSATSLGIYNQKIVLLFFVAEFVCIIYLIRQTLNKNLGEILNLQGIASFFKEYLSSRKRVPTWFNQVNNLICITVLGLAVYQLINYVVIYASQINAVFLDWDAVISWDRWAVAWYHGNFPSLTWHYPQLLPTNWSLSYQFMGNSLIKFFAKYLMGIIEICILANIFALGVVKRQAGYFMGVIFTAWLQFAFGSRGNGYADTPVAFMALSTLSCFLLIENNQIEEKPKTHFR